MNEFEAVMGLCMLDEIEYIKEKRKKLYEIYQSELNGIVRIQEQNMNSTLNYSYFPVILTDEEETLKIQKALNNAKIFPRRYFYPSLDTLDYIEPKQYMKNSRDISKRILCLPLYPELNENQQKEIINIVRINCKVKYN
jgi:dTDP-4-amino-4,6-dideoxygalactose transaminase